MKTVKDMPARDLLAALSMDVARLEVCREKREELGWGWGAITDKAYELADELIKKSRESYITDDERIAGLEKDNAALRKEISSLACEISNVMDAIGRGIEVASIKSTEAGIPVATESVPGTVTIPPPPEPEPAPVVIQEPEPKPAPAKVKNPRRKKAQELFSIEGGNATAIRFRNRTAAYPIADCVEKLGISTATMYRYIRDGKLEGSWLGKNVYLTKKSMDNFIASPLGQKAKNRMAKKA